MIISSAKTSFLHRANSSLPVFEPGVFKVSSRFLSNWMMVRNISYLRSDIKKTAFGKDHFNMPNSSYSDPSRRTMKACARVCDVQQLPGNGRWYQYLSSMVVIERYSTGWTCFTTICSVGLFWPISSHEKVSVNVNSIKINKLSPIISKRFP